MSEGAISAERLRELLLDLEQSQQRERELRAQSDALLAGVRAFTEASSPDDLFRRVLDVLKEPLAFEDAFVLRAGSDASMLVATTATNEALLGTRWTLGKTFTRILSAGRVVVHLDTSVVAEWKEQSAEVRARAGSAICIPLRGTSENALLVCTRAAAKAFQPTHEQMAKRFQPLATQALRDAERVALVERANRDMRLVLDSVDQGLLTVDRHARVVGETSGAVRAWFGEVTAGTPLRSVLAGIAPAYADAFEVGWEQITDEILPLEVTLASMPSRIQSEGRTLAVQLRPIGDEDSWTRMLVVVSDITAALERERAEERRRELAAVVTRIVRDRFGFEAFWDEAREMVSQLASRDASTPDRTTQLRILHTLKGNAAGMGLGSIARTCHALEEEAQSRALAFEDFARLGASFRELEEEIGPVIGVSPAGIAITPAEHAWLVRELRSSKAPPHVTAGVAAWTLDRAEASLVRLGEQARGIGERLGKPDLDVVIEHRDVRLAPPFRALFSALVHAIRNAVDHGIEAAEERSAAGKAPRGTLRLSASARDGALSIVVEDDGRGIDWARVAEKASARGLPTATHEDLVHAILTDGLSTREDVTDVSGRGVGMSALDATVASLGGNIAIESRRGSGTRLTCTFPERGIDVAPSSATWARADSAPLTRHAAG